MPQHRRHQPHVVAPGHQLQGPGDRRPGVGGAALPQGEPGGERQERGPVAGGGGLGPAVVDPLQVGVCGGEVAPPDGQAGPGQEQLDGGGARRPVRQGGVDHRVGVGPAAEPEEGVGQGGGQGGGVGPAEAEAAEPGEAGGGVVGRLGEPVEGAGQHLDPVEPRPGQRPRAPRLLGHRHRLVEGRHGRAGLAEDGQVDTERAEDLGLLEGEPEAAGQGEGVLGQPAGLAVAAGQHPGLGGGGRRPHGFGRLRVGEVPDRGVVGRERPGAVARRPQRPSESEVEPGGLLGPGRGQRQPEEDDGPGRVPAQLGRLARPLRQRHPVEAPVPNWRS